MKRNPWISILRWIVEFFLRYMAIGYLTGLFTPIKVWELGGSKLYAYRGRLYSVDDEGWPEVGLSNSATVCEAPILWLWKFYDLSSPAPVLTTIVATGTSWVTGEEIRNALRLLRSSQTRESA
jgi:hypothetical protein